MTPQQYQQFEALGLNLMFALIFFLIGMAIHDVLKKGEVPFAGKLVVWGVLTFGCLGFIAKGIIQAFWNTQGLG
ncbi:DUF2788 domain-containing protein [Psychrobium sp. MM17-31]|jgi:hypothetical protein|uniref:DUF2788 domain-containing protein n=1 Tax=Psychrobium sp. MM17-31 TaxID=2917758 RepID=UPI001EF43F0D|nr:DUF2788 domain-containing protein [Psychrobium sp. MM17-31]MCG7531923.1 DUF2788 domain-containing protein [Psychrobium sp. MM17-31]